MSKEPLSPDARAALLDQIVRNYIRRGFKVISRSAMSAELVKPKRFPGWLFPEQTHYLSVDEYGRVYLQTR